MKERTEGLDMPPLLAKPSSTEELAINVREMLDHPA
jgi:hypothetical protein